MYICTCNTVFIHIANCETYVNTEAWGIFQHYSVNKCLVLFIGQLTFLSFLTVTTILSVMH